MHTIKKYANRKLYHTNRKQYITLEGIFELIQAGESVQVVDNETGSDITAPILSQVVLLSRGRRSVIPPQVLTDLIQSSGDTLAGWGRSVWSALSGMASMDAEIRRRIQRLCETGELSADEGARIQQLLLQVGPAGDSHPLPYVPSPSDFARLSEQVDALTESIEHLLAERQPASSNEA